MHKTSPAPSLPPASTQRRLQDRIRISYGPSGIKKGDARTPRIAGDPLVASLFSKILSDEKFLSAHFPDVAGNQLAGEWAHSSLWTHIS